jgi:hypothetical protein
MLTIDNNNNTILDNNNYSSGTEPKDSNSLSTKELEIITSIEQNHKSN